MSLWSSIKRRVVFPHLSASDPLTLTIPTASQSPTVGGDVSRITPRPALAMPVRPVFVLIHGSWHDEHAWDQVKVLLEQQGYTVYAPTLYAHGVDNPPADVILDQIAEPIAKEIRARGYQHVIVVGWSFGGVVAQRVAELCLDLAYEVIFLSAFVLRGDSIMGIAAKWNAQLVPFFESLVRDGLSRLPFEVFTGFMPDGSEEQQRAVFDTLKPEPWGPAVEKRDYPAFWTWVEADVYNLPRLHTAYILVYNDMALGPGFWDTMADRLGPTCKRVHLSVGAHECMFTQPEALTAAILEASHIGAPVANG